MGAEHIVEPNLDRDGLQRAGVQVILELDDCGIAVIKVSHPPDQYVTIFHNNDEVFSHYPDDKSLEILKVIAQAEEDKKDRNTKIAEKVGALPASATVEEVIALVADAVAAVDAEADAKEGTLPAIDAPEETLAIEPPQETKEK